MYLSSWDHAKWPDCEVSSFQRRPVSMLCYTACLHLFKVQTPIILPVTTSQSYYTNYGGNPYLRCYSSSGKPTLGLARGGGGGTWVSSISLDLDWEFLKLLPSGDKILKVWLPDKCHSIWTGMESSSHTMYLPHLTLKHKYWDGACPSFLTNYIHVVHYARLFRDKSEYGSWFTDSSMAIGEASQAISSRASWP